MTTIAAHTTGTPHVWRVVKLHFVNRWTTIGVPWLVMAFIFVVNLTIWSIILGSLSGKDAADARNGLQYSGASFYIFVYMLIVAIQAVNITFPFALGYGVTRREFSLGTAIAFVLLSLMYGAGLTLLSFVEQLTNGWGLGGHMFTAVYFSDGAWYLRLFVFTVGMMFFFFIGSIAASVYVRWKANGLLVLTALVAVLALGGVAAATLSKSWGAVGAWFVASGPVGVVAWLLIPTAIAAITGYFVLRRATPKGA